MKKFGVNVSSYRIDDLDKELLAHIRQINSLTHQSHILSLGSGDAFMARHILDANSKIVAVDIDDYSSEYAEIIKEYGVDNVSFLQTDALTYTKEQSHQLFDYVLCQRMIHYLPHEEAGKLLHNLSSMTEQKLFISTTGIESAIGDNYSQSNEPVGDRFSTLSEYDQETFSITEPVCLYTQKEFEALLQSSGWYIEKIWTSAFGNHKAICSVVKN